MISSSFLLRMRNVPTKVVEKIKTHILSSVTFFPKIVSCMRQCGKTLYSRKGHRWQYGACPLRAGYISLQTLTRNTQHLLFFHCNNGCTNAPQYYVIRTLPVLLCIFPDSFWRRTLLHGVTFVDIFIHFYKYIPLLAVTGMVQEQTCQVEEARTECYERRRGSSSGFQERLRHSVQWPDAAIHRHGLLIFTIPVQ